MKLGYLGTVSHRAVIEHSKNISYGINEDTEGIIVESPVFNEKLSLPIINTSEGIKNLVGTLNLRDSFNELHNIINAYPDTYLYGFISSEGLSDILEMTIATRFLTGNIGVQLGFVQGTGIALKEDPFLALPDLEKIINSIIKLDYSGEITIGITKDFKICSLQFGHFTGGFSLFTELAKTSPQENYEWCFNVGSTPKLHNNTIAITTLLSYPPYPYTTELGFSVKAPTGAEKHLYRILIGKCEIAYAAFWGEDIYEACRRCRRTIDNCRNYSKELQYRIDFGRKDNFVLSQDSYIKLGGTERKQK